MGKCSSYCIFFYWLGLKPKHSGESKCAWLLVGLMLVEPDCQLNTNFVFFRHFPSCKRRFKTIQNPRFNRNLTTVHMTITFNHDFKNSNCAPESKSVSIPSGVTLNVSGPIQTDDLNFCLYFVCGPHCCEQPSQEGPFVRLTCVGQIWDTAIGSP